jgi:hypothetical protein
MRSIQFKFLNFEMRVVAIPVLIHGGSATSSISLNFRNFEKSSLPRRIATPDLTPGAARAEMG